jgi:hypothetical protein
MQYYYEEEDEEKDMFGGFGKLCFFFFGKTRHVPSPQYNRRQI